MSNLPDGVSLSMLPGYNDVEATIPAKCRYCGFEGEFEVTITTPCRPHSDGTAFGDCPACGDENEITIESDFDPPEDDDYYEGRPYGRL